MEMIGLDLHKCESQLAIKAENGTITDRRIVTRGAVHCGTRGPAARPDLSVRRISGYTTRRPWMRRTSTMTTAITSRT
jgi:hypothetical protein